MSCLRDGRWWDSGRERDGWPPDPRRRTLIIITIIPTYLKKINNTGARARPAQGGAHGSGGQVRGHAAGARGAALVAAWREGPERDRPQAPCQEQVIVVESRKAGKQSIGRSVDERRRGVHNKGRKKVNEKLRTTCQISRFLSPFFLSFPCLSLCSCLARPSISPYHTNLKPLCTATAPSA